MAAVTVNRRNKQAGGTVLIVAMWIVLVLAGLVLVFGRAMRAEVAASANHIAALEADAVAQAALQFVIAQVDGTKGTYAPDPSISFAAVPVGDGYFWLLNPDLGDDQTYAFGIRDEASRINLNRADADVFLKLPGATSELAASIVDWRDGDDEVTPGGAENAYYLLLDDPYYCKNGPFETVDELLLVKGASPQFLFGEDANRNGVLDANENDADNAEPPDNRDGHLDRGVFDYTTVYSREPNQSAAGQARVDVNDVSGEALLRLLRGAVGQDKFFQVMDRVRGGLPFRNILDFYLRTGLTAAEFATIADQLTTSQQRTVIGLVNVNSAPRQVLLCLPGLEPSDVDALLTKRQAADTDLSSIAWVADVLSPEKATAVGGAITTRSYRFSADIVAVSGNGRAFRRYRTVIDASTSPPRVLAWDDLTHLGWPLAPDILALLRSGQASTAAAGLATTGGS